MRHEKQFLLNEIKAQIDSSPSFLLMRYQNLSANKAAEFRREIGKIGGNVEVMRKRILVKAALAAGIQLDLKVLEGHIGLVFAGNDPIETTKFVFKFREENEKSISVVGARLDGQLYSGADIEKLSKLPGKDEMRAQLLSVFEAPMAQTLAVMDALLASVVYCLDNKCNQANND
jgi:large subunit ribosomal protein L10